MRRARRIKMRGKMRDEKIWQPDVVGIEERQERRIGRGKTITERSKLAAILRTHQQAEAWIVDRLEKLADMVGRAVGRSVIDNDAGPPLVCLRQDRADRILDIGAIIVTGDDDADTRKLKAWWRMMHVFGPGRVVPSVRPGAASCQHETIADGRKALRRGQQAGIAACSRGVDADSPFMGISRRVEHLADQRHDRAGAVGDDFAHDTRGFRRA